MTYKFVSGLAVSIHLSRENLLGKITINLTNFLFEWGQSATQYTYFSVNIFAIVVIAILLRIKVRNR